MVSAAPEPSEEPDRAAAPQDVVQLAARSSEKSAVRALAVAPPPDRASRCTERGSRGGGPPRFPPRVLPMKPSQLVRLLESVSHK